ncbi:deoxyribose-phosphate aldolase [Candidatus Bathyarchaeota archaeon]|nr:deoxyribose-phosphate aldolase [Candidatus Bathyarchaeota archaeon]
MHIKKKQLAKMIDHTLLKPYATQEDIVRLCDEAKKYDFAAVCIHPTYVNLASELLRGSGVKVDTVIGFPLGANTLRAKAYEAEVAIAEGAEELDMVINIGALKSGDFHLVRKDIVAVVKAAKKGNATLKVIIEACYLTDEEKVRVCQIILESGCDFVKTSTGFGDYGAKVEDVKLLRKIVGNQMGVKAAGGIRTYADALKMINAGASRLGASSGIRILEGCPE